MHDSKQICRCDPEFGAEVLLSFVFTNKGTCFHFSSWLLCDILYLFTVKGMTYLNSYKRFYIRCSMHQENMMFHANWHQHSEKLLELTCALPWNQRQYRKILDNWSAIWLSLEVLKMSILYRCTVFPSNWQAVFMLKSWKY